MYQNTCEWNILLHVIYKVCGTENKLQHVYAPRFVIYHKHGTGQKCMRGGGKHSKMHTLAWYHRRRHGTLLSCYTPNTNPQFAILSPATIMSKPKYTHDHNRWNNTRNNNTIRFLSFKTSETQKHLQQQASWMSQMYSSQLWAGASLVDLVMFTEWEKQIGHKKNNRFNVYAHWPSFHFILIMVLTL